MRQVLTLSATLSRASGYSVLRLDGAAAPDAFQRRGYEAVGHFVCCNADLIVAVSDDHRPPGGGGSTADTIRCSLLHGVPL